LNYLDRALTWFACVWVTIAIAVNVVAVVGLLISARSFCARWQRVADVYSPFNLFFHLQSRGQRENVLWQAGPLKTRLRARSRRSRW
jgi:hypothetical protein